jgi:hypothetical protein
MSGLFPADASKISHALNMWANYIETKNPNLSAGDFKNCFPNQKAPLVRQEQIAFAAELRLLAEKESRK